MRTDRVMTRVLSGAAGSVLLLTLVACGGAADEAADETPAASSSAPAEEPSEESESTEEPEEVSGGYDETELLDAMKAAIADNESAHVTLEMNGGQQGAGGDGEARTMTGEGDVSYAGDETSMRMVMQIPQMGGGDLEMRMVKGIMYLAIPPMTPEGKFVRIDTKDPDSPFGDLGGVTQGDPLATFDAFDAGLEDVTYLGPEEVDGEQLEHYVLTVDAEKAAEAQGQTYEQGMPETITYDTWIDDEDLMRRIEFDLGSMDGASADATGGMVMTMSDWGEPVTVEAPPARALMELPGMSPSR